MDDDESGEGAVRSDAVSRAGLASRLFAPALHKLVSSAERDPQLRKTGTTFLINK